MSLFTQDSFSDLAKNRQPRQSRLVRAALECERLGRFDVTLRNVSQTGVGGKAPQALTPGERLTVDLHGHAPMVGTVRWVIDGRFGIETDDDIRIDQLRAVLGNKAPASNGEAEFRIVLPPKLRYRRAGLSLGATSPTILDRRDGRSRG